MVLIRWHGHACVEIRGGDLTIAIDPHDGVSLGIKSPSVRADLILVSHDHFDHNAVHVVSKEGSRVLKTFYGETVVGGVRVRGFKTHHDKSRGAERGLNTVYLLEVEGYRIAHLGDLGDRPEESVLKELQGLYLLVTPVGAGTR